MQIFCIPTTNGWIGTCRERRPVVGCLSFVEFLSEIAREIELGIEIMNILRRVHFSRSCENLASCGRSGRECAFARAIPYMEIYKDRNSQSRVYVWQ